MDAGLWHTRYPEEMPRPAVCRNVLWPKRVSHRCSRLEWSYCVDSVLNLADGTSQNRWLSLLLLVHSGLFSTVCTLFELQVLSLSGFRWKFSLPFSLPPIVCVEQRHKFNHASPNGLILELGHLKMTQLFWWQSLRSAPVAPTPTPGLLWKSKPVFHLRSVACALTDPQVLLLKSGLAALIMWPLPAWRLDTS